MTLKVTDVGFENIVNSTMKEFTMPIPVLHGVPTEYDVCTERDAVDKLNQFQVTLANSAFRWRPIFQQIGT